MAGALRIEEDLQHILKTLEELNGWASGPVLQNAAGFQGMDQRSFQRRLAELLKRGWIDRTGEKQGARYRSKHTLEEPAEKYSVKKVKEDQPSSLENKIPLSDEAKKIASIVTKSQEHRTTVGYNRDWVLSYKPNITYYLSESERKHLRTIGATNNVGQPAGTYARQMLQRLLIDLSWNSSRLEGNTYSLLDTQRLLSEGKAAERKDPADTQMILNHKEAIEFIVDNADETGLNPYTIRNLHGILAYNLLPDPGAPGRLRQFGVGIGKSVYTPLGLGEQIEKIFERVLSIAEAVTDPIEQAFFVMVQLPYLQPFEDVNKRVSRLASNIPLNKSNLVPLSFIDVPKDIYIQGLLGVYELNQVTLLKEVFIWAYERSVKQYAAVQQTLGDPDPFRLRYATQFRQVINIVISENRSKEAANDYIDEEAQNLPPEDRPKFSEAISQDLLSLHEGNFARYRVTPVEFRRWQQHWGLGANN